MKGLPMAAQMLLVSGAAVVLVSLVNGFGSHTAAAYGANLQLWSYIQMPAIALGAAVSSMAAQNVGAGRMDRVDKIAGIAILWGVAMTTVPVLLIYLAEPYALALFLPRGSPSIPIAAHMNHIMLLGFIPFGVIFVLSGVVRSTGAVWPPLATMILASWLIRIPGSELLIPHMGADAIWWTFPAGSLAGLLFMAGYYRWGGWRKARLLGAPEGVEASARMG